MRRRVLPVLGAVLTLGAAAQAVMLVDGPARLRANAEPAEQPEGVDRADEPTGMLTQDQALDQAPASDQQRFQVPQILAD